MFDFDLGERESQIHVSVWAEAGELMARLGAKREVFRVETLLAVRGSLETPTGLILEAEQVVALQKRLAELDRPRVQTAIKAKAEEAVPAQTDYSAPLAPTLPNAAFNH